ncbi:MAG: ankyrin repeat domain-containing protein [Alphaproteobacteria bacterium]|nr:ankyrin repeat domain-containing protein [Alphaproteobacteria bacterium]
MKNFFNSLSDAFKPKPNKVGDDGYTRLQRAIYYNDASKIKRLIEKGANVNYSGRKIHPPLHMALLEDKQDVARILIAAGADISAPDAYGQTPLHYAAALGQESIVMTLLKMNANPNAQDDKGNTPLHSVSVAAPQIIDMLVENGAEINAKNMHGNTALHRYLLKEKTVSYLLRNGADPNLRNNDGLSAYSLMLKEDRLETYGHILQLLMLHSKPDPGVLTAGGEPLLHAAGRMRIGELFLKALEQDDLSIEDSQGNTVLHTLTMTQDTDMMAKVLKKEPGLLTKENHAGQTPLQALLQYAINERIPPNPTLLRSFKTLLDHGADPNTTERSGVTLLQYAVAYDQPNFVEHLLTKKQANPDLRNVSGQAALHIAVKANNMACLDRLLDAGADPNLIDGRGWTLLDRLAEAKDRESPIVQRLITGGGTYSKMLPLDHAAAPKKPRLAILPPHDKGTPPIPKH